MAFNNRRNYFNCIFIYKCLNHLNSDNCHNFFQYKTSAIKTRSITKSDLFLPKFKLKCCMNSTFYTGIKVYNDLNINLKNEKTFKNFVKNLKITFKS